MAIPLYRTETEFNIQRVFFLSIHITQKYEDTKILKNSSERKFTKNGRWFRLDRQRELIRIRENRASGGQSFRREIPSPSKLTKDKRRKCNVVPKFVDPFAFHRHESLLRVESFASDDKRLSGRARSNIFRLDGEREREVYLAR